MKLTLGVTWETDIETFQGMMYEVGWPREVELSPEEYEIVANKFVHRDDIGRDQKGPMCWRGTVFRPASHSHPFPMSEEETPR